MRGGPPSATEKNVFQRLLTPAQQDLWQALLLSHLGTQEAVAMAIESEWSQNWCLLDQLVAHVTEKEYESLALLFVTMFKDNTAAAFPEDKERIASLQEEGKLLQMASPHNANNCLLDALVLALVAEGLVETDVHVDMQARARICATCRQTLVAAGAEEAAACEGIFPFLDAQEHSHIVLPELYRMLNPNAKVRPNFEIRVYTRFDSEDVRPEEHGIFVRGSAGASNPSRILCLYNHTSANFRGFHFDALVSPLGTDQLQNRTAASKSGFTQEAVKCGSASLRRSSAELAQREGTASGETAALLQAKEPEGVSEEAANTSSASAVSLCGLAATVAPKRTEKMHLEEFMKARVGLDVTFADEEVAENLGDDCFYLSCLPASESSDPRAEKEALAEAIADQLSARPTLPNRYQWIAEESKYAMDLPDVHCAFATCSFETDSMDSLLEHLSAEHEAWLATLAAQLPPCAEDPKSIMAAYRLGLSHKCQREAPFAHVSLDRRALRNYRAAMDSTDMAELICLICARRYAHNPSVKQNQIRWRQLLREDKVLNCTEAEAKIIFGKAQYCEKFLAEHTHEVQAKMRRELDVWTLQVCLFDHAFELLCCPEDKACVKNCPPNVCCSWCRAPVCATCFSAISQKKIRPVEALSNDMMVFYAPREIYEHEATFMELLCASPCLTSMVCFSLEKKLRSQRALDEDAFMNRHRLAARGNATTFPLPWEQLLQYLHQAEADGPGARPALPRLGSDLRDFVSVILKTSGEGADDTTLTRFIHQACVRRHVVVALIEGAIDREHRAYTHLNKIDVRARAEALPTNGVPEELVALLSHDNDLERIQRQKAATPVRGHMPLAEVAEELGASCKPNAVVNERTSLGYGDADASAKANLLRLAEAADAGRLDRVRVTTGQELVDQFEPWYFGVAFAFLFKYCTGMPDPPEWSNKARWRRQSSDPHVSLASWTRAMARRVEAQLSRDWTFGFASWNLLFRSAVNLARTVDAYDKPVFDERDGKWKQLSAEDIEHGALQLVGGLVGSYTDSAGRKKQVQGDVSKLPFVPGLGPAARKLLRNLQHATRILPGTQDARRIMRFEIQAMRIRYGVPLFVTFSPDEAHQLVYVRMARVRETDPVRITPLYKDCDAGSREWPPLDACVAVDVETLRRQVPNWDQRRAVLARDPLACVDGFRVLVQLTLQHLFGLNVCAACPRCNACEPMRPCQDVFGSSATCSGGVFGRMDAAYLTFETQKSSGSQHAHGQCFVQCLHQHTPLEKIFRLPASRAEELRDDYLRYNAHVAYATYSKAPSAVAAMLERAVACWPEHKDNPDMIDAPGYQRARAEEMHMLDEEAEATAWCQTYLDEDVGKLQTLKQHHVHNWDADTQEFKPLTGCQRQDRPNECKSAFPRTAWLREDAAVLCPCLLKAHEMEGSGRKNRLASLHGPYSHKWLNPCHPAMLAALRGCNVDVQVPYRLPFKCRNCGDELSPLQRRNIIEAAQRAQDAQTGYCADYCAKCQPMAFHEINEFRKGHIALHKQLAGAGVERLGKRHTGRFLSDAYCKGIVRGQVECCNLRANHVEDAFVASERFSTTNFVSFPGREFLNMVQQACGDLGDEATRLGTRATARGRRPTHLRDLDVAQAY
ncbi:unnamed protein product, partial [Effrenium voratum]